jgi:nicotinamidase-related amidase
MTPTPGDYLAEFDFGFTLDARDTALVLIDLQYATASRTAGLGRRLAESGRAEAGRHRFDRIERTCIPAIQGLLDFFRRRRLPVIHVTIGSARADFADLPRNLRQIARAIDNRVGQPAHEVLAELAPLPGEIVVNKTTNGAFQSTGLDAVLRTLQVRGVLFCGVSTEVCVESTARVAVDLGYDCVIVEDGCASGSAERHDAALRVFARSLGRVATAAEILRELAPGG